MKGKDIWQNKPKGGVWRVGGGGRICVERAMCAGRLERAGVRAPGLEGER